MKLLALDAATEACSAALWQDGAVRERFELIGRGHADRLLPMAEDLLSESGLTLRSLDAIAFGRGPGGFTGLRIAAGVAQGLALGAGLPVVPVSDLAALALAGHRRALAPRVLAVLDARMGQVYWAAFDCQAEDAAALTPERLSDPAAVVPPPQGPWFGAGPGFAAYPLLGARLQPALAGQDGSLLPRAGDIAAIAAPAFAARGGVDAARALPVYLRDEVVHRRRE